jgi:caffeoyl-CoA O-methyltransferase
MADPKSFLLTPELGDYLVAHGSPPDAVQAELITRTSELGAVSGMQVAPEQGAFLTLLTQAIGARRAIEIGTFTGYSALCIARGLPADGQLVACDVSDEWTSIGRPHWERAGVASRIDLRIAPALKTIAALDAGERFDLAFIDADKPAYPTYYEEIVTRLRPNGVILVDNTLQGGRIVDPEANDESVVAMRAFNDMVAADTRVESALLTLGDGLTVLRKR